MRVTLEQYMFHTERDEVVKLWEDNGNPHLEHFAHFHAAHIRIVLDTSGNVWATPEHLRKLSVLERLALGIEEPATKELLVSRLPPGLVRVRE